MPSNVLVIPFVLVVLGDFSLSTVLGILIVIKRNIAGFHFVPHILNVPYVLLVVPHVLPVPYLMIVFCILNVLVIPFVLGVLDDFSLSNVLDILIVIKRNIACVHYVPRLLNVPFVLVVPHVLPVPYLIIVLCISNVLVLPFVLIVPDDLSFSLMLYIFIVIECCWSFCYLCYRCTICSSGGFCALVI